MREIITFLHNLFPVKLHNRIVLVGGTVRDMLHAKESQDIDIVAALSHDELMALGFRLVEATSSAPIQGKRHLEAQEVAKSLGFAVCPIVLYLRAAYGDAPTTGQTVTEYEPGGKAALEIEQLYKFTCNHLNQLKGKQDEQ